jgi:hypothetical protein
MGGGGRIEELGKRKMSIRRRVEDAIVLYDLGRFEGALLSVLIAAASTAKKEKPSKKIGLRYCV